MSKTTTTYVRITFGFDKNKLGNAKFYRRGKGANLTEAISDLFRQRGNNFLPENQKESVKYELSKAAKSVEDIKPAIPKLIKSKTKNK